MTQPTDLGWIEISQYDLGISHTEDHSEAPVLESLLGMVQVAQDVSDEGNTTMSSEWPAIKRVEDRLVENFDITARNLQWLSISRRDEYIEGIDAPIASVVSTH